MPVTNTQEQARQIAAQLWSIASQVDSCVTSIHDHVIDHLRRNGGDVADSLQRVATRIDVAARVEKMPTEELSYFVIQQLNLCLQKLASDLLPYRRSRGTEYSVSYPGYLT